MNNSKDSDYTSNNIFYVKRKWICITSYFAVIISALKQFAPVSRITHFRAIKPFPNNIAILCWDPSDIRIFVLGVRHPFAVDCIIVRGKNPLYIWKTWMVQVRVTTQRQRNYIHYKMWDEVTHPFPNFNVCTLKVWEWISNFIPHCTEHLIIYPFWDSS